MPVQTKAQKKHAERAKTIHTKEGSFIEIFDNIPAFLKALDERPKNKAYHDCSETGLPYYSMTKNYPEACTLMKNGYSEGCKDLRKINVKGAAAGIGKTERNTLTKSVSGVMPITPLAMAGVPNCMVSIRKNYKPGRVIDIYYCPTVGDSIHNEELITVNRNFLMALQGIERNGVRVNLYCGSVGVDPGSLKDFGYFIKLKNSDSPLNIMKISYPLIHPSFLRRHTLRHLEHIPIGVRSRKHGCYIYVLKDFAALINKVDKCKVSKDSIFIDFYAIRHESPEEIYNHIVGKE